MNSPWFYVFVAFLISIGILGATVESTDSNGLPPILRAFHQKPPEVEADPARLSRVKRQNGVIIDSIFQIPIQTLGAVNNLFKNSVLAFQSWRQGTGQVNQNQNQGSTTSALQYSGSNSGNYNYNGGYNSGYNGGYNGGNGYYSNNYNNNNYRPRKSKYQSAAAVTGDLPVKGDGSSYRI